LIQESQKQNQENPSETAEKIVVEFERSGDVQFAEMMPYFEKEAGLWLMGMSMPTMNKNYGIQV